MTLLGNVQVMCSPQKWILGDC